MPTGPGKFRVMTTSKGKKVRLHLTPLEVVDEAKRLSSGATHTPREFAVDKRKRRKTKKG